MLKEKYPNLFCYAFSPPGATLSFDATKYAEDFILSIVIGKDMISRYGNDFGQAFHIMPYNPLQNNMYITRALIGRSPCLDQAIQTRKSWIDCKINIRSSF